MNPKLSNFNLLNEPQIVRKFNVFFQKKDRQYFWEHLCVFKLLSMINGDYYLSLDSTEKEIFETNISRYFLSSIILGTKPRKLVEIFKIC